MFFSQDGSNGSSFSPSEPKTGLMLNPSRISLNHHVPSLSLLVHPHFNESWISFESTVANSIYQQFLKFLMRPQLFTIMSQMPSELPFSFKTQYKTP